MSTENSAHQGPLTIVMASSQKSMLRRTDRWFSFLYARLNLQRPSVLSRVAIVFLQKRYDTSEKFGHRKADEEVVGQGSCNYQGRDLFIDSLNPESDEKCKWCPHHA